MRLTQKKIEEIITDILGDEGLSLLKHLFAKENVSEFDLANKTKKDIKVIRKMLYLLYNHNLVAFTRKKDKQKGWYVYYWTLLPDSIRFSYFKKKTELLARLKARFEEESKELFFSCQNNCVRLNFDESMDFEFRCPECGELISQDSSEGKKGAIKNKIKMIEEELEKLTVQRKLRRERVIAKAIPKKVKKKPIKKKTATKKVSKPAKKKVTKKKVAKKKVKRK